MAAIHSLSPQASLPLWKKRVLVTAPRQYAPRLISAIIQRGGLPVWLPTIEVCDLEETDPLDNEVRRLVDGHFTHVLFTSRNGIDAVMRRAAHILGGEVEAASAINSSGARVYALGADSNVLRELGVLCATPREPSTQGLVRDLEESGEALAAVALCPVPRVTGGLTEPPVVPKFLAGLEAAGAKAVRVDAYVTRAGAAPGDFAVETSLLKGGEMDVVVLSSTVEAQGLLIATGGADALASAIAKGLVLAAHGPYTAKGAQAVLGYEVPVVGQNYSTFDGVCEALSAHFNGEGNLNT